MATVALKLIWSGVSRSPGGGARERAKEVFGAASEEVRKKRRDGGATFGGMKLWKTTNGNR